MKTREEAEFNSGLWISCEEEVFGRPVTTRHDTEDVGGVVPAVRWIWVDPWEKRMEGPQGLEFLERSDESLSP